MLSYQHIYHAGNMADVQKHLWLIAVLDYLKQKDKPFTWIDTHAGRGLYDLTSTEAQKIKEHETGISKYFKTWQATSDLGAPLSHYYDLLKTLNSGNEVTTYPGSAYIAATLMRNTDKLFAFDLHKGEYPYLESALKNHINATTRFEDGFTGLKSLTPPILRRGGVLIDPSYELKDDYTKTAQAVIDAHQKWPQGIYMIWYPILDKKLHQNLLTPLKDMGLSKENFTIDEWHFGEVEKGMKGTGMIIINPPYGISNLMSEIKSKFI